MKLIKLCQHIFLTLLIALSSTNLSAQDMVQATLDDTTFHWFSSEGQDIRIYYQQDSFAHRHRQMLLRSANSAVKEASGYLGIAEFEKILRVFYLNSRTEMERVVGRPCTGFANWDADAVFVVVNPDWRSFEKHEITHVLTMLSWGSPAPSSSWMIEGIAIASDGWCREYSVDQIASHYLSQDMLPQLTDLFDDIRALGEVRGGMIAASLIGFIRHTYGPAALRRIWLNGTDDLSDILSVELDQLESTWHDYLRRSVTTGVPVDLDTIMESGCG
ncbi:MAG: hypothetical protein JSU61_13460 [Fidelibacterota bacterium]|nr:MAG: hypothetical protein JSU61_13460 [Candidatus Neomarinimicrobiota bacterium]